MHRQRLCIAMLAVAAGAAPNAAQALRVDYIVDLAIERNDNLLLTPADPIAITLLRPGLGFEIVHDTSHVRPQRLEQIRAMTVAPEFARFTPEQRCITTVDFIGKKPRPA